MNQRHLAGLQRQRVFGQEACGHPLQHHSGRFIRADFRRNLDHAVGRDGTMGGVSAKTTRRTDFVPDGQALHAEGERQWGAVKAGSVIGIDEIQAYGVLRDQHLTLCRGSGMEILPLDHLRTAGLANDHAPSVSH